MQIAMVFLLLSTLILTFVILFLGTVHPFWAIIDCAMSPEHSKGPKIFWILFMLLSWAMGSMIYGLLGTRSARLKKTTILCLGIFLLIGLPWGVIFASNSQARAQFIRTIQKELRSSAPQGTTSQSSSVYSKTQTMEIQMLKLNATNSLIKHDFNGAAKIYTDILEKDSSDIESFARRGFARMKAGEKAIGESDLHQAIRLAEVEMKKDLSDGRLFYLRGTAYRYLGQFDKAIDDLKRAVKLSPGKSNYPSELKYTELEKKLASLN